MTARPPRAAPADVHAVPARPPAARSLPMSPLSRVPLQHPPASPPSKSSRSAPGGRAGPPPCPCPTDGVIEVLGKKWTLCLVATLANRPGARFNQLQAELSGVSPRTLSQTLKELERHGVIGRQAFAEVPPRVEYRLTAKGLGLVKAVRPMLAWAEAHGEAWCPACVA